MSVFDAMPADWLIPHWPVPPGVRAVFTSRAGGFSAPPFDSFNLGLHVGDSPQDVAQNRMALQRIIGAVPIFINQVHGQAVLDIVPSTAHGQTADASVTRQAGVACTVMVADCLPVLMAHMDAPVVAAAHAGWRGLAGRLLGTPARQGASAGVLASTFESFASAVNAALPAPLPREAVAARTLAWLGPCIGPRAFEVGSEVKAAFIAHGPAHDRCFTPLPQADKYLADLPALGRLQLASLGVDRVYGNDGSAQWCTVSQASRFFSHRRSGRAGATGVGGGNGGVGVGGTGRMAACIWLV